LIFLHLNIIFNPSNPSNHSQTLTTFALNPLSLPPINLDGKRIEGRWKFLLF